MSSTDPIDEVVDSPAEAAEAAEAAPAKVVYSPVKEAPAAKTATSVCTGVVSISALKFESYARNSASVKIVQERLMELGFMDAGADKPGWLSVGTRQALGKYCGCIDKAGCKRDKNELIVSLFKGTTVIVTP
jgi:hypothetical protein